MWKIWFINADGLEGCYTTEYETQKEAKAELKEILRNNTYIEGSVIISGRVEEE